jgi:hypothetical protein
MGKESGLGDNCYVGGYDLSGDIGSLSKIAGPQTPLVVTGINKLAYERIGGKRDGRISWTAFFNTAANQAHPVLSALPTVDVQVSYWHGQVIGNPAGCMVAKQINYDATRGTDGALTFAVDAQANGYGLEWGNQLTAGIRTDTAATNGTAYDTLASAAFGAQAYLHVFAFTGTDVTVKLQDSADNSSFTDLSGAAFTQITTGRAGQRLALANNATVRRYVRASTVTTGGFTSLAFAVVLVKNAIAGQVF